MSETVVVPREPTPEMLAAVSGFTISVRVSEDDYNEYPVSAEDCEEIYRVMLAAAPSPAEGEREPFTHAIKCPQFNRPCNCERPATPSPSALRVAQEAVAKLDALMVGHNPAHIMGFAQSRASYAAGEACIAYVRTLAPSQGDEVETKLEYAEKLCRQARFAAHHPFVVVCAALRAALATPSPSALRAAQEVKVAVDSVTQMELAQVATGNTAPGYREARRAAETALWLLMREHGAAIVRTLAPAALSPQPAGFPAEHLAGPADTDFEQGFRVGFNRCRERWLAALSAQGVVLTGVERHALENCDWLCQNKATSACGYQEVELPVDKYLLISQALHRLAALAAAMGGQS